MKKKHNFIYIILVLFIVPFQLHGWSLKTHIWIGQQVLNDALDDGALTLLNQEYPIPGHVLDALRQYPGYYLMGNMGPDVFPDPIVGQTTTHPGIENGWKTDEWIDYVLNSATNPKDIAFAFGYAAHAAADIFAHTYVNQYAGDVFELTDGEREVELRHFVLEKYIESRTPQPKNLRGQVINLSNALNTPQKFLSRTLILDKMVSDQNSKVVTGLHLFAMYEVLNAVQNLDDITSDIITTLTDFAADYYKKVYDLTVDVATGKTAIDAAQESVRLQKKVMAAKKKLLAEAEHTLKDAQEIIEKNPELITHHNTLLAEQAKLTLTVITESTKVGSEVSGEIALLDREVSRWLGDLAGLVCKARKVTKKVKVENLLNPAGWVWKTVVDWVCDDCSNCEELNRKIAEARNSISQNQLQAKAAEQAVTQSKKLEKQIKEKIDNLKDDYDEALIGLTELTFETAITAAKTTLEAEEELLEEYEEALDEAERILEEMKDELDVMNLLIDEIKKIIDKYNLLTLYIQNWEGDIENATEKYIEASHSAGNKMLTNSGNPLDDYLQWHKCYGQVFMAIPEEVGEGACEVERHIIKIKGAYDDLVNELPEILQWLVNPTGKASEYVLEEIEPELEKAKREILEFITDETTADFLLLLSNPENVTEAKLNNVYRSDQSGKGLLTFDQVSDLINNDLDLTDGKLNPETFSPLKHAVTLAKLCLLGPDELNKLITDQLGSTTSSYFGEKVYSSNKKNFCFLLDAVMNIDGNHQWQAFGLPYPRRERTHCGPDCLQFGYDFYRDNSKGFKLYVDPYLREKVFIPLFVGSMIGTLGKRPELSWPAYKFPECAQNPFPSTQNTRGQINDYDNTCQVLDIPNTIFSISFSDSTSYKDQFFEMDKAVVGRRAWTIVASFDTKEPAIRHRKTILNRYPDMYCEVWEPANTNNPQWTVMVAAGTDESSATKAKDLANKRKLGVQPFVWSPKYPWKKYIPRP